MEQVRSGPMAGRTVLITGLRLHILDEHNGILVGRLSWSGAVNAG
jgi:hypothetical protein